MELLQKTLEAYGPEVPVFWVQEEPRNMGAWYYLRVRFGNTMFNHAFEGVSRPESASPATGSGTSHKIEQQAILKQAFEIE